VMLARLERELLSRSRPHLSGGDHPKAHGYQPGHWLADWAKPWGAAPRIKLDADIGFVDGALKGLGRWLSKRTVAKADGRARERLEAITTSLQGRDPQAPAAAAQGTATKARRLERPMRTRVVAIAGLFLLAAGAGALLLTSQSDSGPGDSGSRRGAVAGVRQHSGSLDAQIQRGSVQDSRRGGRSASPPAHHKTKGSARATSQGAGQSAPVASEIAPPAPEPAPFPQTADAPQPAPAPAPPSSPSTTPTQAKSGGGGGCPPEFGYEC
jgi:hypothetical protein